MCDVSDHDGYFALISQHSHDHIASFEANFLRREDDSFTRDLNSHEHVPTCDALPFTASKESCKSTP